MKNKISLKPKNFSEFIGQKKIKKTIKIMINASIIRKEMCDHILLHGKAGMGKTSLASLVAKEMKVPIKFIQGPLLEKKSDILSLFSNLNNEEVIFIDEIHGINNQVEELMYSALEEGVIDIQVGIEGEMKTVRMKLPRFTVVGATTKLHLVSKPLKERFGLIVKMGEYSHEEILKIISETATKMNVKIEKQACYFLSLRCKRTPRVANMLLKRVVDFSIDKKEKVITLKTAKQTMEAIGVYEFGLNESHIVYLKHLLYDFSEK